MKSSSLSAATSTSGLTGERVVGAHDPARSPRRAARGSAPPGGAPPSGSWTNAASSSPAVEHLQHPLRAVLAHHDVDPGIAVREPAQHVRQPDGAERARRPEREPAAHQAREVLHLRRRGRDLAGDLLRARQQRLARLGEPDRAGLVRANSVHAQRRFELLDVVRHRRLREPELLAGAREVAMVATTAQKHASWRSCRDGATLQRVEAETCGAGGVRGGRLGPGPGPARRRAAPAPAAPSTAATTRPPNTRSRPSRTRARRRRRPGRRPGDHHETTGAAGGPRWPAPCRTQKHRRRRRAARCGRGGRAGGDRRRHAVASAPPTGASLVRTTEPRPARTRRGCRARATRCPPAVARPGRPARGRGPSPRAR